MRLPFTHRRERTVAEIAAKATYVGSAEALGPQLGPTKRTSAEHREAIKRIQRLRANGGSPS
ncbi:MAG: hypothetical protein M3N56_00665 [Actinomycetota bacterium]|jgi:hypothetical protein|nr:hypothetical protein [Actinomycetota bacterium]